MNILVIIARIIFPIIILWYPLFGGSIAIGLDNLDWHTKELFGMDPIGDYQIIDKILDQFYFSLLAIVALRFKNNVMKKLILGLFIYRTIGFILFEFTQIRMLFFIFPNIFENLFFFYYILQKVAGYEPKISYQTLSLIMVLVTIPKMLQEYSIHIIEQDFAVDIFGFTYIYEGTWHQIMFLLISSVVAGLLYKAKKDGIPNILTITKNL